MRLFKEPANKSDFILPLHGNLVPAQRVAGKHFSIVHTETGAYFYMDNDAVDAEAAQPFTWVGHDEDTNIFGFPGVMQLCDLIIEEAQKRETKGFLTEKTVIELLSVVVNIVTQCVVIGKERKVEINGGRNTKTVNGDTGIDGEKFIRILDDVFSRNMAIDPDNGFCNYDLLRFLRGLNLNAH